MGSGGRVVAKEESLVTMETAFCLPTSVCEHPGVHTVKKHLNLHYEGDTAFANTQKNALALVTGSWAPEGSFRIPEHKYFLNNLGGCYFN